MAPRVSWGMTDIMFTKLIRLVLIDIGGNVQISCLSQRFGTCIPFNYSNKKLHH